MTRPASTYRAARRKSVRFLKRDMRPQAWERTRLSGDNISEPLSKSVLRRLRQRTVWANTKFAQTVEQARIRGGSSYR